MVEITYLAIGIIALVAMFFGYGFGLFEGRNQGYKKRIKEEAAERVNAPEVLPPPDPEPVTIRVDDPGLLRIKNEQGYVTLDLDGARVDTTALTTDQSGAPTARGVGGAALVTDCRVILDRKGNPMAFVTVEDVHGSYEIIVFSDCYQKRRKKLQQDQIIVVAAT